MKENTTADRLKQLMQERNIRQVDILRKCEPYCNKFNVKLGRNDLSQYISGKFKPGQTKLTILGLALGVSETWLMGYDVSRQRQESDIILNFQNIKPIEIEYNAEKKTIKKEDPPYILQLYNMLPFNKQSMLIGLAEEFLRASDIPLPEKKAIEIEN